ncbi:Trans-aconitate 2-methyltransferase [subsurface metagenome]
MELNPWEHLSEERLKQFLTDPLNNENAEDRKIVIDYLRENFDKVRLLDVGCGTGHQYLALKQSGWNFDYCGVDKTKKMVDFARRRFPDARFHVGDIHELPSPARSWQVVYVRHVFTHLPGYKKALAEVAKVCSDCLIICLLKPLADKQEIRVIGKPPNHRAKPVEFSEHYLNVYSREPFMTMLKSLGFDVVIDEMVEVGGYFGRYEVLITRRRCE